MLNRMCRQLDNISASISRRDFFAQASAMASVAWGVYASAADQSGSVAKKNRFFFTSQGKTAISNSDGSDLHYLKFDAPGQATWQPGPVFSDGRRVVVLSMEPRRDGEGRSFEEYYHQTPCHIWLHDLETKSLEEICTKDRIAPFTTPALLIADKRLLIQVIKTKPGQIFSVNLDGSDPREFTKASEGLPYGFSSSPDGKRIAFHLASNQGYQVWTADPDGGNRTLVAAQPGHLYFGTNWSPDGKWVLYVDCVPKDDHSHDWCDVCIGKADGSEHRVLTEGQSMWFAATYGSPKTRGGGSNVPSWTRDGQILFPQRTKGAKVPWEYRVGKPDLDHFNRDFKPELAKGGSMICKLDPASGATTVLTPTDSPVWDFRASQSFDGEQIVFCRAGVGEAPAIWVMDSDGKNARMITRGIDDLGADHPRWIPSPKV